ncbi:MAG: hypothetical protein JXR73_10855 [Candidatus Omnitrophica bacterium]|nr:hypothetical protein [Candidatus Omnitrophota bacterium]
MKSKIMLIVLLTAILGITSTFAQDLPVDHEAAGINVVVPDTWIFKADQDNGKYWEPFTDIFGDGTVLVGANTYPENEAGMNMKVAFVDPASGEVEEYWAFYTDAGEPWTGPFNEKRTDGNPARVAADRTPGGTRYIVGMESTPYLYDEFNTEDRWWQDYAYDDRVGTVQIFNKTADGPVPITNAFDPIYQSGGPAGAQNGSQMRYGGELRFLSNGNILTVVEDQTKNIVTSGNGAIATIFNGETGEVIKAPFNAAGDEGAHSIWSNVAAFNGGFCVRSEAIFTVYDNDGNMQYFFNQQDIGITVADTGRGDGSRICSNIGANYVYFAGKDSASDMVVARFDAVNSTGPDDIQGFAEIFANEETYLGSEFAFDRAEIACDDAGNFCVVYEADAALTSSEQVVARIFDSNMEPVTPSFYAFQNHDGWEGDILGINTHEPNVAMNNQIIAISADGIFWDDELNDLTPAEQALVIVLESPFAEDTSVQQWDLY